MAGYIGSRAVVATSGVERKKTFAITTTTTSLTGLDYTPNHVHVFHNGIRLVDGTDYTATNGTSITLVNAAENGDEVVVVSYGTFSPADTYTKSETYTKTEADDRYVNASGDTMTGDLLLGGARTYFGKDAANFHWLAASDIPSEPNRLAYGFGSDGSIVTNQRFFTNGLQRMKIDSAGRVTMPYQPAFHATTTNAFLGNGSVAGSEAIILDSASVNVGSHYDTSTGRFTAPVAGVYHFSYNASPATSSISARYFRVQLLKNGAVYLSPHTTISNETGDSDYNSLSVSGNVYLNENDYVHLVFGSSTATSSLTFYNLMTFFSGHLIG